LKTRLDASLRSVYGLRGFEAALSDERAGMMREVREQLRPDAESLGLEIADVRVRRTDLTQEVSQQTYERMKAERLAQAEFLRARGRVAAQRIKAIADRQVVEIVAEARKESEIARGEGEGERSRIFADVFSKDPDFFAFYRSMAAYGTALDNTGTTMVLSPNSEFFRYFQDANGATSGAVPPAPPALAKPAPQ
jgi:membrane protease subunit HflC